MGIFSKPVFLSVGGFEPGSPDYVTETIELMAGEAIRLIPALVRCVAGGLVPEIEDAGNPFDGWQVQEIFIGQNAPQPEDDEDAEDDEP